MRARTAAVSVVHRAADLPLHVRNRRHVLEPDVIPRFYACNDPLLTSDWNALSLLFPAGERLFIRSVRSVAARLRDKALIERTRKFCRQEGMHAREHEVHARLLRMQGYAVDGFVDWFENFTRAEVKFSPTMCVAISAGVEHLTACIGRWTLRERILGEPTNDMRRLLYWHAAEELEHKSVVFDVLQEVAPGRYALRMAGYVVGMLAVALGFHRARRIVASTDRARNPRAWPRRRIFRRSMFWYPLLRDGWAYCRPGFHPSRTDDRALAAEYLAQEPS